MLFRTLFRLLNTSLHFLPLAGSRYSAASLSRAEEQDAGQNWVIRQRRSVSDASGYKAGQLRHSCCVVLLISHTTSANPGCRIVIVRLL
ncbi:hypothetical protein PUN28_012181 [Cardiocondyla obscurior]|uniref:Secreted protein n=1 Tax=Cardiocondyla obscurior TaxID=286306 RepID=A0AAW2F9V6_9HYME